MISTSENWTKTQVEALSDGVFTLAIVMLLIPFEGSKGVYQSFKGSLVYFSQCR